MKQRLSEIAKKSEEFQISIQPSNSERSLSIEEPVSLCTSTVLSSQESRLNKPYSFGDPALPTAQSIDQAASHQEFKSLESFGTLQTDVYPLRPNSTLAVPSGDTHHVFAEIPTPKDYATLVADDSVESRKSEGSNQHQVPRVERVYSLWPNSSQAYKGISPRELQNILLTGQAQINNCQVDTATQESNLENELDSNITKPPAAGSSNVETRVVYKSVPDFDVSVSQEGNEVPSKKYKLDDSSPQDKNISVEFNRTPGHNDHTGDNEMYNCTRRSLFQTNSSLVNSEMTESKEHELCQDLPTSPHE